MRFDVVKHHRWWFILSSTLVILSLVSIFFKGFNFGIDYTGGTILDIQFAQTTQVSDVRNDLKTFGLEGATIQVSGQGESGESGHEIMIRTRNLSAEESKEILSSLASNVGPNEVKRIETVGAVIGSEVTKHAILNLVVAFLVLAAYISYRFEMRVAVSTLTAIFHDMIMVLGVFSFFQLEIDASFLAAILTVVGYSMNEAVVIFDRIRENTHTHKRTDSFADLANDSIKQTIHRSIYTLSTVLFATGSLYIFGGDTTKNFALCMIVGFISGAYSAICVATSIWSIWKSRDKNDMRNKANA